MEQSERRRGSGAKLVYDSLRAEILDLVLPPGSPLDEVQLAERFDISRTPVREALVRLSGEGLVVALPNRSTMVAQIDFLNLGAYFDALVLMHRATARLAARHHGAGDLLRIRQCQNRFAAAVQAEDGLGMIATNVDFHLAIAECGKNSYFSSLLGRLLDEGRRLARLYYQSYHDRLPQPYVDEHEAIVAAIAGGDEDEAEHLARLHAEQVVSQIKTLLTDQDRLNLTL